MITRLLKNKSAKFQIALGLSGILISLILVAAIIGIVPDRNGAIRDGHAALAESIAINSSIFITRSELRRMEANLKITVKRNKDILSAAVRRADGEVIVAVGDHQKYWKNLKQAPSTDAQVSVPIFEGSKKWGQVELRFATETLQGWLGQFINPVTILLAFISFTSFIFFYLYLGKMLKQLDPSQAIPDRVRSALDTMAEGLLVLDAKQNIVLANQAFCDIVDQSAASLLGKEVSQFPWLNTENETPEADDYPWSKTLKDGVLRTSEVIRMKLPDVAPMTFMTNCSPVLGGNGKPAGVLISIDDVTELEQKEIELRQSKEEAEAANRSKSDFLANMSHEIRTPMNAILGFAEVLKRSHGKSAEENIKYLNTISSSGTHLLNLINDILDLSKVEAGRIDIERLDCPVHHIIQEVVQIMKVKANEKGINLEFKPAGQLPEYIDTDPGKIRQIVTNLVGNAIKFTEKGGVTIITRFHDKGKNSILDIDVVDTGIGMTTEQAEAVFNPFTQADSSITRRFGGTGLGLTISKRFAEALGGGINITSTPGRGSTFSANLATGTIDDVKLLSIEEIVSTDWAKSTTDVQAWEFPAAKILVVDDGTENRELLEVVLGDLGLEVTTAENGKQGFDLVSSAVFDIVLMDVQMPVMDGYTAVRLMRESGYQRPVIALTADAMKGAEQACLDAGYSGYMSKPIDIDVLTEKLAHELGGKPVEESKVVEIKTSVSNAKQEPDEAEHLTEKITSSLPMSNSKFRDIVEKFIIRLHTQLDDMEQARQTKDYIKLQKLAHWLKGSAGSVGFHQFTEKALELELCSKDNNDIEIEKALVIIRSMFERIDIGATAENQIQAVKDVSVKDYSLPEKLISRLPDTHPKFRPIIEKFVIQLEQHVNELDVAVEKSDFDKVKDIAYWIKGAAGSVGFDIFTEPAKDLEMHAKENNLDMVRALVPVIQALESRITLTELEQSTDINV